MHALPLYGLRAGTRDRFDRADGRAVDALLERRIGGVSVTLFSQPLTSDELVCGVRRFAVFAAGSGIEDSETEAFSAPFGEDSARAHWGFL